VRKVVRRIRNADAALKKMNDAQNVDQKQVTSIILYRIRMLDARLAPIIQADKPTEEELAKCDQPDPPPKDKDKSDSYRKKERKWREDDHKFQEELHHAMNGLVQELQVDAQKRFAESMADERRLIETKYGKKVKHVAKLLEAYRAELATVKLALQQLAPLQQVRVAMSEMVERLRHAGDVPLRARLKAGQKKAAELRKALAYSEFEGEAELRAGDLNCAIDECAETDTELLGENLVLVIPNVPPLPRPLSPPPPETEKARANWATAKGVLKGSKEAPPEAPPDDLPPAPLEVPKGPPPKKAPAAAPKKAATAAPPAASPKRKGPGQVTKVAGKPTSPTKSTMQRLDAAPPAKGGAVGACPTARPPSAGAVRGQGPRGAAPSARPMGQANAAALDKLGQAIAGLAQPAATAPPLPNNRAPPGLPGAA